MELTVDIPRKYVLNTSPEELKQLLKLNTAVDMYKNGQLSSGAAVEFVGGIDRYVFLYECRKRGVESQTYENREELEDEVAMLDKKLL